MDGWMHACMDRQEERQINRWTCGWVGHRLTVARGGHTLIPTLSCPYLIRTRCFIKCPEIWFQYEWLNLMSMMSMVVKGKNPS
jgi:hypothetical protein